MTDQETIMIGVYDYRLVTLSVLISILGSYAARDLFEKARKSRRWNWLIWLAGGATADGIGTWSMHYTGMMALSLPVSVLYDWPTVALSLLVGFVGSGAALLILLSTRIGWVRIVTASIFLGGVGISGLHYIAMAAMRLQAVRHYSLALVTLSVVMAILICWLGLWLAFLCRAGGRLRYHGSVWLRGAANPVMHYIAMASIAFTYSATIPNVERAVNISPLGIAGISVVPVLLLFVVLLTSAAARDRKQRALLDELFEQAPQAVALMSVENRVIRVNRDFTRLFGYTAQEAQDQLLGELIIPDEFKHEDRRFSELVAQGKRVEAEGLRHRKDGSHLNVSIIRVPVSLPDGQIATYGIYRDITERKRAEKELLQTQARIESILESVADVHILFDRDWGYLYVNEAAVRATGRPREQILGRTLWDLYPDIVGTELARNYRRAMEERCFVAFDFHYLSLDTWWENRFYPVAEGLSIFATNITERKRVEEQLRQSEESFRQLAESITEVFWMTDPGKQQVLYVSPGYEKIWGRPRESVYEDPTAWIDAIHPEDRHRVERSTRTHQVLGTYDEEFRIIRPDGSVRWVRDRAFPIKDISGRVNRVTGIAEDITERKLAEAKLRATTEQLRALSASLQAAREEEATRIAREIHDELGAALSSLRWDLQDLDEALSESESGSQLRELRKKIEAMMTLTDATVNAVRRIASELRPSALDDLGLIEAIEWQARQFQDRTGINVECDCPLDDLNLSREQSTAVFRIFQEALTNILRHAQATKVNVQTKEEDGEFILTISDNGRGITDEEKSGQRTLGLMGMRERAHLIGGKIEIVGSEGKGSLVIVQIPIRRKEYSQAPS